MILTGVMPKLLPVLSTEPVLRKVAVDREIRLSSSSADVDSKTTSLNALQVCYFSVFYIIRDYHLCVCTCAYMHLWYFLFPPPAPVLILLSMNCHSNYDNIDGGIAGNRRPYPDIFQRAIKSSRVHELCQTHFVVET